MITFLSMRGWNALLAGVALGVLLTPAFAMSAEREGTVLFFSLGDLHQVLSHPSLPSLSQLPPSLEWWAQDEVARPRWEVGDGHEAGV